MVNILILRLANVMITILPPLAILAYANLSTPMPYLALVLVAANGTFHAEGGKIFKAVVRMKNMEGLNASVLMKVSLDLHLEERVGVDVAVDVGEGAGVLYEKAT